MNLSELKVGDKVNMPLLCMSVTDAVTKGGKAYYSLILQDTTCKIEGKIWDIANVEGKLQSGDVRIIHGTVTEFQGNLQITVEKALKNDGTAKLEDFFIKSSIPLAIMQGRLKYFIKEIKDETCKLLITEIFFGEKGIYNEFCRHQGAKSVHHGYVSGLLEHTIEVCDLVEAASRGRDVDYSVLITSAILHDIGKIYETAFYPINEYTDKGKLVGHVVMSYTEVVKAVERLKNSGAELDDNKALHVEHCLLAHHGQLDWGSPVVPQTVEAIILSQSDLTSSRTQTAMELVQYGVDDNGWTAKSFFIQSAIKKF